MNKTMNQFRLLLSQFLILTGGSNLICLACLIWAHPTFAADEEKALSSELPARDYRIPLYTTLRPQWAIGLNSSLNALGGRALTSQQGTNPIYAFQLLVEYQPAFLQSLGVMGIGPSATIYPIFNNPVTYQAASIVSVGGQIRYQARFFREQPIVPFAGYSMEYLNYQFTTGASGIAVVKSPIFGAMVLLNFLEPSSAAQFFINNGILRSYAIFELRNLSSSSPNNVVGLPITISGLSSYFGLRFEF